MQQEKKDLDAEMAALKAELVTLEERIKQIGAEMQKNETKNSKIKCVLTSYSCFADTI